MMPGECAQNGWENACVLQKIKGIYMMPAGGNPTNIAFSNARKKEIARIIKERNLIAVEDDNYAALLENRIRR